MEHALGRQRVLLGGVPIDVAAGGDDGQPAGERQLVAHQRQPRSILKVRPVDEREHASRRQARGLAAGAPGRLQLLEDLAPPLVVDRLLQGDDVEARQAPGDRLGAGRDIGLVARPLAQHVADQRQVGRDELDVVAGDAERAVRRRRGRAATSARPAPPTVTKAPARSRAAGAPATTPRGILRRALAGVAGIIGLASGSWRRATPRTPGVLSTVLLTGQPVSEMAAPMSEGAWGTARGAYAGIERRAAEEAGHGDDSA